MKVSEIVNVSIGLSAVPASQTSYGVPLLLVDHADIPIDRRYTIVTRSSYTTTLTAATDAYTWCQSLWGQNYTASQAYIGRWISTASASYCYCPSATSVASVYAALTSTAQVGVKEGSSAAVEITPDFTGDTTMPHVAASITAAMSGDVAAYVVTWDSVLSRFDVTSDNTGASADSVSLVTPAAGIDLTGALYMGSSVSVAGYDAETPGAAAAAVFELDNTPFIVCERGCSTAEQVTLSTSINALDKVLYMVTNDANTKDSGDTTDSAYQIKQLSHQKTWMVYTEHTTQNPDAAVIGEVNARADSEGEISLAFNGLIGVSESGLDGDGTTVVPLTPTERSALEGKGCDYLISPAGITHARNGLAVGGNEMRVMIGKSYLGAKMTEDVYAYLLQNTVVTFSDPDIQAIKGINSKWAEVMADRGLLDANSFVYNYPAASAFTSTQKASHTMTLSNVFDADVLSSVNDMVITMAFTI